MRDNTPVYEEEIQRLEREQLILERERQGLAKLKNQITADEAYLHRLEREYENLRSEAERLHRELLNYSYTSCPNDRSFAQCGHEVLKR